MRFRRRKRTETRWCRVDLDRRARLLVMPNVGGLAAPPAVALDVDADDAAVGAAVRAALAVAWQAEEDDDVPDVEPELDRLGVTWDELDAAPGLGVEASATQVRLEGLVPWPGGGRGPAEVDVVLAEPSDEELGAAARGMLRSLGPGLPVPEHAGEPFGFKTCWLAFGGVRAESVADALGLARCERASWRGGVRRAGEPGTVFVTPDAGGWTFAVGVEWLDDLDVVARLSDRLGVEVQYFATHRVPEAHVWARAEGGRLTRAAGYVGERGEAFGEGEPTEVERRLGFDWALPRWSEAPELDEYPTEETVAEIAGAWSVNPLELGRMEAAQDGGLLGRASQSLS